METKKYSDGPKLPENLGKLNVKVVKDFLNKNGIDAENGKYKGLIESIAKTQADTREALLTLHAYISFELEKGNAKNNMENKVKNTKKPETSKSKDKQTDKKPKIDNSKETQADKKTKSDKQKETQADKKVEADNSKDKQANRKTKTDKQKEIQTDKKPESGKLKDKQTDKKAEVDKTKNNQATDKKVEADKAKNNQTDKKSEPEIEIIYGNETY